MRSTNMFGTMVLAVLAAGVVVTIMLDDGVIVWIPILLALAVVAGVRSRLR